MARPRKLPKILSAEDAAALLQAPNVKCPTGLRNRCLLELMYRCGLRVSETCALRLLDVNLRTGQIHIRPETAKGGREGYVPLDPRVEPWLQQWKAARRPYAKRSPLLFITLQGGPVSRHYCWQMMRRYSRRAGLPQPAHPHVLRHSYATELLREGFNIREVQQLLRHADIRTTAIYTSISDADLHRKIRARPT